MPVLHFFRIPGPSKTKTILKSHQSFPIVENIETEYCYNIEIVGDSLPSDQHRKLLWLLRETFEPENFSTSSFLDKSSENKDHNYNRIIEVGPRLAFSTAFSSNCISMCKACNIDRIVRIEKSRRYLISSSSPVDHSFIATLYDRMTECIYDSQLTSFDNNIQPLPVKTIPLLTEGKSTLEKLNKEQGLGFDDWDIEYYYQIFVKTLKRNPTDVECFDLGQSNSEHSRHWFFGGKMIFDGKEQDGTLFSMVKGTLKNSSKNSVIAFHDNSSAIEGFPVSSFVSRDPTQPSPLYPISLILHPILTAETHNFPSGVAPFPGAETGTGGRLRDVQATGRGAHCLAGIVGYCVGSLNIPGHDLPWESKEFNYPSNLAKPLDIKIEASNGASDYGNKFGEPVVAGFTRSYGQIILSNINDNGKLKTITERREWIKPIMFTAGTGMMDSRHSSKKAPEPGMVVCKIGGPAYRIGMGGGAASSRVQGTADAALDFNAVQRGDAEMENRMNRVVRGCIELGDVNPIISIHDQGAGGNGNVLKEIVDPLGAIYEISKFPLGDPTLSVMEIWGAEYQENNAILVHPSKLELVMQIGLRENCPVSAVGTVTGDGKVTVIDRNGEVPFDMPLSSVLGKMPQKSFNFHKTNQTLAPLDIPSDVTVHSALLRVLALLDVGSKRYLTNKVDRSVTGLVAQQQCVGILQTPLSNVAVLAQTYFDLTGVAIAVGEQPIKGLISPIAQARMTVGEALTNMMWAKITGLKDIKASCNWMWASKLPGEGPKMWDACKALTDLLLELGVGIDGGKDSLSMAAQVNGETVKAPGEVTLTCYVGVPDITKTITPDFKYPGTGVILYVDLGFGFNRLGGTALATVFGQLGNESPDVSDSAGLVRCFNCVQDLVQHRLICAGHDRSDGGLIVTLCEMAFAGNCGLDIDIIKLLNDPLKNHDGNHTKRSRSEVFPEEKLLEVMFSEELGIVLEVMPQYISRVKEMFSDHQLSCVELGLVTTESIIHIRCGDSIVIEESMVVLRDRWESTSFALEKLQCDPTCVEEERQFMLQNRPGPAYKLTFDVSPTPNHIMSQPSMNKYRMAVIRQEGSNGDRELAAAFYFAGFEVWDVNMEDLVSSKVTLDKFKGIAFCGGFSYADVNDSAKGWAGVIRFNESLLRQFEHFRTRSDTFSLGICNGCQLMALLGWVPFPQGTSEMNLKCSEKEQPRFIHNKSGRFESRWATVVIQPSPAVMLKGMEGSSLGVWLAHGEGRLHVQNSDHLHMILQQKLAPLRYVNDSNQVTTCYPMNPNGSPEGIAALCSPDGRHLAMMPHPERCFLLWQSPYLPNEWKQNLTVGPWLKLFQNARLFCENY